MEEEVTINHYPNKLHYGYTLKKRWYVIKAMGILFFNHDEYLDFKDNLEDFQESGAYNVGVFRNQSSGYFQFAGTGIDTIKALYKGKWAGIEQIARGGQERFKIGMITFEEAGN